jgi:hypothetical protein
MVIIIYYFFLTSTISQLSDKYKLEYNTPQSHSLYPVNIFLN